MDKNQALQRAAQWCSRSEKCLSELRTKLLQWQVAKADAQDIEQYLLENGFIDQVRYAQAYTRTQLKIQHWGRHKIWQALVQKQIHQADIQAALDEIDLDEYQGLLAHLLQRKEKETGFAHAVKLMRFAISRGFEPDLVRKTLGQMGYDIGWFADE